MAALAQVAIGGALGAVLRYLLVAQSIRLFGTGFPLGTLTVNILGSFVMGLIFVWIGPRAQIAPLLMVGVLGGFTTFSAFSLDAFALFERGETGLAALYVLGSALGSVLALFLGVALARGVAL